MKLDPFKVLTDEMAALHTVKNAEYGDAYRKGPVDLGIPVLDGIAIRMADKYHRFANQFSSGQASGLDMRESLIDLANYAILAILEIEVHNKE